MNKLFSFCKNLKLFLIGILEIGLEDPRKMKLESKKRGKLAKLYVEIDL